MSNPFETAWKYHSLNLCVIPSGGGEKGKSPILNTWTEYQARRSTDAELIGWNDNLHPKLWGMVTGPVSSIFVIDCDTPEACGMFDLAGMPPHVRTPRGGAHYYFRYPQFRIPNATGILPQIDVRGEGGFVNFAGGKYDVKIMPTDEAVYPMTRMPRQILTALQNPKTAAKATPDTKYTSGNRNDQMFKMASAMRGRGATEAAIEAGLLAANQEQCAPPLPDDEVKTIAHQGAKYEPNEKPETPKFIPELKGTLQAGVYVYSWDKFSARLSRIKESRDRTVGELQVIVINSEPVILLQENLNLLSARSRQTVAKVLIGKAPDYDWDIILEQICTQTLAMIRGGDAASDIVIGHDASPVQRPDYILYPLIVRRMPNCIFGDPGTLKSTTALLLSQIARWQWADNPIGVRIHPNPMRGLYLDWETDENTTMYQLYRLGKGLGFTASSIAYRPCALPLHNDLEQICKYVTETKADYIIVDSLAMASGGEPKETSTALSFFAALRQIRTWDNQQITSVILAHNSKNLEEKRKSIYGNMQYTAQMRNIWESVKRSEEGDDEIDIALFHRKPPPFGKFHTPLGWKYVFNDAQETIKVERADPRHVEEFVERMGTEQRILSCLSGGMQTNEQLADRLGTKDTTIRSALSRLATKGHIQPVGRGAWELRYE